MPPHPASIRRCGQLVRAHRCRQSTQYPRDIMDIIIEMPFLPTTNSRFNKSFKLACKDDVGGYSVFSVTKDSLIVYEQTIGGEPKRWAGLSMTEKYFDEKGSDANIPIFQ